MVAIKPTSPVATLFVANTLLIMALSVLGFIYLTEYLTQYQDTASVERAEILKAIQGNPEKVMELLNNNFNITEESER